MIAYQKKKNSQKMRNLSGIILATVCVLTLFVPQVARAQMCDTLFEVITTIRPPTFGFPTVWDAKYGQRDSLFQMGSGVTQDGGTVFMIGRQLSQDNYKPEHIVLAEINRRGRALKEEKYPAKEAEEPIKMIQLGSSLIAISNMRGGSKKAQKWVRVSWYDKDGKYKRERILKDAAFDYEGMGMTMAAEKEGFVVILRAVNRQDETDQNGVLMRFTPGGELLWRRVYRPGIPNILHNLIPIDDKDYMATGQIRLEDGRMAGWAMKLGFDGAVHWQRTYPRGGFSVFRHVALSPDTTAEGNGFLLAGDSEPLDGGPMASWILAIDALGEPQWQRYYRRPDYELTGNWIVSEPDGRIILIMNAKVVDGQSGQDHVRMLTLSPRGVLVGDESYFEGLQAVATDYVPGWNGERVLTAIIEDDMGVTEEEETPIVVVGLVDDGEEEPEMVIPEEPVQRGWVFVATALDPYEDPCATHRNQ